MIHITSRYNRNLQKQLYKSAKWKSAKIKNNHLNVVESKEIALDKKKITENKNNQNI